MTSGPSCAASTDPIAVLLPVYNGARFLREQLESIFNQQAVELMVICRDDHSSDESPALLKEYALRYPDRFILVEDRLGNLGAKKNFSRLMAFALDLTGSARYANIGHFALSDQDDIWHPDKLQTLASALRELEQLHPCVPALVHGDLRVVDERGQVIAPSMARYQGLQPHRDSLAAQLISNTVTGCTALMNRSLVERSLPVHADSIMHDWWLSLVVSAFGQRRYLDIPLLDYRQHGANTIGAKAWVQRNTYRWKSGILGWPHNAYHLIRVVYFTFVRMFDDEHNLVFQQTALQAQAFLAAHGKDLSFRQRLTVRLASGLRVHFAPLQRVLFRLLRAL